MSSAEMMFESFLEGRQVEPLNEEETDYGPPQSINQSSVNNADGDPPEVTMLNLTWVSAVLWEEFRLFK